MSSTPSSPAAEPPREPAPPVRYEVRSGVATITLDRPAAMNSLDLATKEALLAAVRSAAEDDAVRCVLLTGSGRAFCVGQDLKEHLGALEAREQGAEGELGDTVREHYNAIVTTIAQMPKPVVAAVNGVAAGAGASLAFACDLRVLAESAGFNLAFAGIALSCDTGISWTLPRLIGSAAALELLYFPRTVPAEEAQRLGLATSVVPDDRLAEEGRALAERLASGPTRAYAAIRSAVAHSATAPLAEALEHEAGLMSSTGSTRDHRAAVAAFVAKQRPVFEGR